MEASLCRGQLTKWKDDRGFGFIQPVNGGREIFLHISAIKDATRRPRLGDTIYYQPVTNKDGKISACNAFILGARSKSGSPSSSPDKTISSSFFPVRDVLLLSILPLIGSIHFIWKTSNPIPIILYPAMSLLTFALYADDKSRAKREDWRTSEQMLHLSELAGGWLGGFIAQRKLRHKSIKSSYQIVFWAIVVLHLVFWLAWLVSGGTLLKVLLKGG
jgi:uncharacterized membrane protein YsdA (DUF1294 family)/cold shock CspA family protein